MTKTTGINKTNWRDDYCKLKESRHLNHNDPTPTLKTSIILSFQKLYNDSKKVNKSRAEYLEWKRNYLIASEIPSVTMMTTFLLVFTLRNEWASTRPPNAYESLVAKVTHAWSGTTSANENENLNESSNIYLQSETHVLWLKKSAINWIIRLSDTW